MCRSEAETNTRISDRTVIPTERSEWRNLQFQHARKEEWKTAHANKNAFAAFSIPLFV